MDDRALSYDFFELVMPPGGGEDGADVTFDGLVGAVAELEHEDRNLGRRTRTLRLQHNETHGGQALGDMINIRMEGLPVRASLAGETQDLDLEDNEGIGDGTAFLYDQRTRCLVVQRARNSIRASSLVGYFQSFFPQLAGDIELLPILRPDAYARMTSLTTVRRMEISVAGPKDLSFLKDKNLSVGHVVALSEYFQAPRISITLSMGHQKEGGFSIENVLKAVKVWEKAAGNEAVERFAVKGSTDDNDPDTVDLVSDRLRHVERLQLAGRTLTWEARRDAIRRAWNAKQLEVASVLTAKG